MQAVLGADMTTPFDTTRPAEEFRRIASELRDDGWYDVDELDIEFLLRAGKVRNTLKHRYMCFAQACYELVSRPKMVPA